MCVNINNDINEINTSKGDDLIKDILGDDSSGVNQNVGQ